MAIEAASKFIVVTGTKDENELFKNFLKTAGYEDVHCFLTIHDAYEHAVRHQTDIFICGFQLPDGPGVVLLQRLRETGNYGLETYLFVGNQIDNATLNLFFEHDIHYVLKKPFTEQRVLQKITFMRQRETKLPPVESVFREAQAAYNTKLYDMAFHLISEAEKELGSQEKFEILKGKIRLAEGQASDAKKHFQTALKINSQSVWAQSMLAKAHMELKDFELAKDILDKLVKTNPHHLNVLENAGLSNFELGHFDLSRQQMEQLTHLEPDNKVAAEITMKIKIEQGDINKIAQELAKTHNEREVIALLNSAGIALAKKKRNDEALQVYFDTLEIVKTPEYAAKVHYNIGLTLLKMNLVERATQHLEEAIATLPDFEKAKMLLDKAKEKLAA